jgi:hypothetical protein
MRRAVDVELHSEKARLSQNPIPHFGKHISSSHSDLELKACRIFAFVAGLLPSRGEHAVGGRHLSQSNIPHYLLVFSLTWLYRQTLFVHLMHISSCLHIAQYVLLQLWYWLQGVRYILVLLNITNDFRGFGAFSEVYQCGLLND